MTRYYVLRSATLLRMFIRVFGVHCWSGPSIIVDPTSVLVSLSTFIKVGFLNWPPCSMLLCTVCDWYVYLCRWFIPAMWSLEFCTTTFKDSSPTWLLKCWWKKVWKSRDLVFTRLSSTLLTGKLDRVDLKNHHTSEEAGRPTELMEKDDETTAYQLHHMLIENGIQISFRAILRCRSSLGWTFRGSAYCQLIHEQNKAKRLEWCQRYKEDAFENVIWTDESTIQLENHRRFCCRKIGQAPKPKPQ